MIKSYNISFPINDDNETNSFIQMNQVTKEVYSSNLLLLLLTKKGERYYDPDYGTNLIKFIFEPNDNLTSDDIEEEIRSTVTLYIPEIKITSVEFNWVDDEQISVDSEIQLNVKVLFTYSDDSLSEEGSLDLNF